MKTSSRSLAACLFMLGAVGCGGGPEYSPLRGTVTIDGEPLTRGVVKFAPEGGRQSMGKIQPDGTFVLGSYSADDGVALGVHRVAVVAREQLTPTSAKWYAPKEYANYNTSSITQTVDAETDSVAIELTWGGQKGPYVEQR